jgi:hypothetical protein
VLVVHERAVECLGSLVTAVECFGLLVREVECL